MPKKFAGFPQMWISRGLPYFAGLASRMLSAVQKKRLPWATYTYHFIKRIRK
jgi:hypothetical protein